MQTRKGLLLNKRLAEREKATETELSPQNLTLYEGGNEKSILLLGHQRSQEH